MTAPAIAILTTGERVPLTDSWDEARRLLRDGGYDPDDVVRIEQAEDELPPMQMEPNQPLRQESFTW